jgi:hypothetical protein
VRSNDQVAYPNLMFTSCRSPSATTAARLPPSTDTSSPSARCTRTCAGRSGSSRPTRAGIRRCGSTTSRRPTTGVSGWRRSAACGTSSASRRSPSSTAASYPPDRRWRPTSRSSPGWRTMRRPRCTPRARARWARSSIPPRCTCAGSRACGSFDLLRERIHPRPRPRRLRQPAAGLIAGAHPMPDRLVITADQLRCRAQRTGRIERFQDLHHFLRGLQAHALQTASSRQGAGRCRPVRTKPWGDPMATMGRSDGRQWGHSVAAYGEIPMAAVSCAVKWSGEKWSAATRDAPNRYAQARSGGHRPVVWLYTAPDIHPAIRIARS